MSKYTTGNGEHFGREVRAPDGRSFAWCGQANGLRVAKRIARALNSHARQAAQIRELKEAWVVLMRHRFADNPEESCIPTADIRAVDVLLRALAPKRKAKR